ncbi:MAG: phospho-sugar mutase [Oscillospiraceae bacterium]|nr:phospho-sugar mutase [Oscillospiraceae bacterium]
MNYTETYAYWLASGALSESEKDELRAIIGDEKEIESRFYGGLEFGTAGLRGIMGLGTARMNIHVIRHATRAFAEVILAEGRETADKGIAICYDCRNNSRDFARAAACVMAGSGIPVRIFSEMRPTPELSFAVRYYGCAAGLNVTASHNPKEYNGYKVYWSDGAQLPPNKAALIKARMEKNDVFAFGAGMDYDEAKAAGLITELGSETDDAFLECVMGEATDYETVAKVADSFKMVYTPFHGTGRVMVPYVLHRLGIKNIYPVEEQMVPDGNFSTVSSPNPENPEGFALAIELADKVGADFILGTDPDTDRIGILVRDREGVFRPVSGNKTGVLLLDYIIGSRKRAGTMPEDPVALKTIVTTEMARVVAETNGVRCYDTFTGFKFMAEKKNALEAAGEGKVIFSYEESYGYMMGDYVRDKDAVTGSLVIVEMAAWYASRGMSLWDAIDELSEKYGFFDERTVNLYMPGLDGMDRMAKLMDSLRNDPPAEIASTPVVKRSDYLDGTCTDAASGEKTKIELSGSNVLRFALSDGTVILARPSGTEPKIKVYILARGASAEECLGKLDEYGAWAESLK